MPGSATTKVYFSEDVFIGNLSIANIIKKVLINVLINRSKIGDNDDVSEVETENLLIISKKNMIVDDIVL